MTSPAFLPAHVSLAEAARIARRHGFVLRVERHAGRFRIVMVRPERAPSEARVEAKPGGASAA